MTRREMQLCRRFSLLMFQILFPVGFITAFCIDAGMEYLLLSGSALALAFFFYALSGNMSCYFRKYEEATDEHHDCNL